MPKAAKAAGANIVIVSTHAGDENVAAPNAQQRRVAKALAASGAVSLILGNHVSCRPTRAEDRQHVDHLRARQPAQWSKVRSLAAQ